MSIGVSFIICVVWTLIAPEKDKNAWANYKNIEVEDGEQVRAWAAVRVVCPENNQQCQTNDSYTDAVMCKNANNTCVIGCAARTCLAKR